MNKPLRNLDDPAEKMAELESEIERQDAELEHQDQYSKYAPKQDVVREKPVESKPEEAKSAIVPPVEAKQQEPEDHPEEETPAEQEDDTPSAADESVESELAGKEKHETPEGEEKHPGGGDRGSSLWWNILVTVLVVLVAGMGYLFYDQSKTMPDDPLDKALNEKNLVEDLLLKKTLESNETKIRALKNQKLKAKAEELYQLRQSLGDKEKQIDDLQREMASIRAQMKSYFMIYKDYARKKARNLQFDSLTTVKTKKTYLDVTIRRVTDSSVSIVHAGGATNLEPSDLSEALQKRLAFGDPLGLADMDKELAEEEGQKSNVGKYLPQPETFGKPIPEPQPARQVDADAILNADFDPPAGLPNVETKPAADGQN